MTNSQQDEKELAGLIDQRIKSDLGQENMEIAEFMYHVTKKLRTVSKGTYGIEGSGSEPYPVLYPNTLNNFPKNELELFKDWFTYFSRDKLPRIYQRWALISLCAALLERNVYMQEGSDTLFPNLYIALVGDSGTGKTRTIKRVLSILKDMGYDKTTSATTTREKFIEDLENGFRPPKKAKKVLDLDEDIFGDDNSGCHAGYIVAEEWKDFFKSNGNGNEEWISLLEKAFDCPDTLDNRVKTGKGTSVKEPVLNMLGAVTPDNLNDFTRPKPYTDVPISGRIITVYSPAIPKNFIDREFKDAHELDGSFIEDRELKFKIIKQLNALRDLQGRITWDTGVYTTFQYITSQSSNKHIDTQHSPYYNRRELHLKKLCMVLAAMSGNLVITMDTLYHAEEILLFAESFLPVAVGFPMYGFFDMSSKRIMQLLNRSHLVPTGSLLDRVAAVIPDKTKFETQKETLNAAKRLKEIQIDIKDPYKHSPVTVNFFMSQIMDYRLKSVLKVEGNDWCVYEYFLSLSEIVEMWNKQQIDVEELLAEG